MKSKLSWFVGHRLVGSRWIFPQRNGLKFFLPMHLKRFRFDGIPPMGGEGKGGGRAGEGNMREAGKEG